MILHTSGMSLSEHRTIKKWFWQKWKILTFIMPVKGSFSDKIYYRIRFRKEGTNQFLKIIRSSPVFKLIPASMYYKFSKNN